jgi:hypothetical protein
VKIQAFGSDVDVNQIQPHRLVFYPGTVMGNSNYILIKRDGLPGSRDNDLPVDGTVTTFEFEVKRLPSVNPWMDIVVGNIYKRIPLTLVP